METGVSSKILVVGQSARMLAQSAVDAGYQPIAVDCYADSDSRALVSVRVASLAPADLLPAVEALAQQYGVDRIVYGSGFEYHTESLALLADRWQLLGNPAEVLRRFQNKQEFFGCLTRLGIEHPSTVFAPPANNGWLQKPLCGEGGTGIRRFEPGSDTGGACYWQRFIDGDTHSALFLADGGRARILGVNRQWSEDLGLQCPFAFAGISNHADIASGLRRQVRQWLAKLMRVYPLRGLGSLDFIVQGDCCCLLELNARIPASAQLYGKRVFDLHVRACSGGLITPRKLRIRPRGYQIVYARQNISIDGGLVWPDWAVDRPPPGVAIGAGQPICSIIAGGRNARQVHIRLRERQGYLENLLKLGR